MHPLQIIFIAMMLLVLAYLALRVLGYIVRETNWIDRLAAVVGPLWQGQARRRTSIDLSSLSPEALAIRARIWSNDVKTLTETTPETPHNILSSQPDDSHTNTSIIPVCEASIPVPKTVDDIINYLADVRIDSKKPYTFSSNQIYELVKGDRNDVLKKVRERREKQPEAPEEQPERMIMVRDVNGQREIPI